MHTGYNEDVDGSIHTPHESSSRTFSGEAIHSHWGGWRGPERNNVVKMGAILSAWINGEWYPGVYLKLVFLWKYRCYGMKIWDHEGSPAIGYSDAGGEDHKPWAVWWLAHCGRMGEIQRVERRSTSFLDSMTLGTQLRTMIIGVFHQLWTFYF